MLSEHISSNNENCTTTMNAQVIYQEKLPTELTAEHSQSLQGTRSSALSENHTQRFDETLFCSLPGPAININKLPSQSKKPALSKGKNSKVQKCETKKVEKRFFCKEPECLKSFSTR